MKSEEDDQDKHIPDPRYPDADREDDPSADTVRANRDADADREVATSADTAREHRDPDENMKDDASADTVRANIDPDANREDDASADTVRANIDPDANMEEDASADRVRENRDSDADREDTVDGNTMRESTDPNAKSEKDETTARIPRRTFTDDDLLQMLADVIKNNLPMKDVQLLLRAGVHINGMVKNGLRPLHYAAYQNNLELVKFLCNNGALVNLCDEVGYTPLHLACKAGHLGMAQELVNRGAITNFIDIEQSTGASENSRALARLTVQPLNLALENNNTEVAELLLQNGANANECHFLGYEINLVPMENTDSLKLLLKYGADPNSIGRSGLTPLMKASKEGWIRAVRLFLEHGADVNLQCPPKVDQKSAIHFAAASGNIEVCRLLLEAGAKTTKPDNYETGPLEFAITNGKKGTCRILLRYGADANELNADENSPLQLACAMSPSLTYQSDIIKLLLEYGANPRYCMDMYSYRLPSLAPIVEYLCYGEKFKTEIIHTLLYHGSEINIRKSRNRIKILDCFGIADHLDKLEEEEEVLDLILQTAGVISSPDINYQKLLSASRKKTLQSFAAIPRPLKHQIRIQIRRILNLPLPEKIELLPLPRLIKDYLSYNVI